MKTKMMKRIMAVVVVLVMLVGVFSVFASQEDEMREDIKGIMTVSGTNPKTPNDLVHDGDMYVAGQNCIVTGEITGNVFVAGSDINFSNAKVGGSIFVASSKYSGDVELEGSLYIFSGEVNDNSTIEGNVYVFGGEVNLTGNYNRSVIIMAGNATLAGKIKGDLQVSCSKLTIKDSTTIEGEVEISVGSEEALNDLPPEYRSNAKIVENDLIKYKSIIIRTLIVTPIFIFLLGMLFIRFWENKFKHIQKMVKEKCGWSLLVGLGLLVLTPIAGIIVIAILWPSPLFPVVAIVFASFLMAYLGGIVIMQMIGKWIWKLLGKKNINKYIALLTGVIVVHLIFMLPLLVPLLSWVAMPGYLLLYLTGAGAFTISVFRSADAD